MELAFAGLHQICAPILGGLDRLPGPQRDALAVAFGLDAGEPPDRFLVGLSALGLFSEASEKEPLLCIVDDLQWLDSSSAQALAFVARRLDADPVGLLFAARVSEASGDLAGLPELQLGGLANRDARALLRSVIQGPLDELVCERIVAETRGNPLALLELPRRFTAPELAGGFGLPDALSLSDQMEHGFRRSLATLPPGTQRLLLVAAAEPTGDPVLLSRAAEQLGIAADAGNAAEANGLIEFGARVTFRHPLVRSAVYRSAPPDETRAADGALARATDASLDPDRRAWHLARATAMPDEGVAAELERSAGHAQARGGLAAAAAFLERSADLTPDPARRRERALAAAGAKHQAGAFDAARELLAAAEAGLLDELQRAQVERLRAQVAFATRRGSDAPPMLLEAAKRLEDTDTRLARETYLEALSAALFAGRLASGSGVPGAADAARRAPRAADPPRTIDLLLDGLALLLIDGYAAGAPVLSEALAAFRAGLVTAEEELRWLWLACHVAIVLWDDESWDILSSRQVQLARTTGALAILPIALSQRIGMELFAGEVDNAASLVAEVDAVTEVTGSRLPPYGYIGFATFCRSDAGAMELLKGAAADVVPDGEGVALSFAQWATAMLQNSAGRYDAALAAATFAAAHPEALEFCHWGLVELIEAAARCGRPEPAAAAFERLLATTQASGTGWALGIEACCRALLSDETAEVHYREALKRLGSTRLRGPLARAHLLYGEWLRRKRRRTETREQLRTAHAMLTERRIEAFTERAARELLATGETARRRRFETNDQLTPQEFQIARLARDGFANPDIAAQLFISRRTVECHLRNIFTKLGISLRIQLASALADPEGTQQTPGAHMAAGSADRSRVR